MDLDYLLQHLNASSHSKYFKLNATLCELIEEFDMVGFVTLNISDKSSVFNVLKEIDKSNGYIFGGLSEGNESILMAANATDYLSEARDVQQKYAFGQTSDLDDELVGRESAHRGSAKDLLNAELLYGGYASNSSASHRTGDHNKLKDLKIVETFTE
ncbi:GPN-loop GTPase 2 [Smittium culicis]|uniref:GPN-loop GTPase 2 n=1 Tax=Smittium culicis TaxID=133412 RepID=A0A1R1YD55_9FUNG|nr:GPN-loop GTPase 2 [Smittium culicis]